MSLNFKNFRSMGFLILLLTGVIGAGAATPQAHAYEYWNHGYGGGHWIHDRHDGRLGWWWVNGAAWAFYPRPYPVYPPQTVVIQQVPVPAAPQVIVQQQPAPPAVVQAPPVLYYCKATETYYPDTMNCPGGWSTMVAGAPPTSPAITK